DIAGQNVANPLATILAAAMMLRYSLQLEQEAQAIEAAVNKVLAAGGRTRDICGGGEYLSTTEMGDRVVQALE
ncbi:MAG: isocitrate/isopropylmalate family dehydrogenase, partial [Planctomyces sp.]